MRGYNKLVRDKIPHIIASQGLNCDHVNIDLKYPHLVFEYLLEKLKEEVKELEEACTCSYMNANKAVNVDDECADVVEVINAISNHFGKGDWQTRAKNKYDTNGGFDNLTVLLGVDDE